jgi:hypothetical protein
VMESMVRESRDDIKEILAMLQTVRKLYLWRLGLLIIVCDY